jgi:hypothetical protein
VREQGRLDKRRNRHVNLQKCPVSGKVRFRDKREAVRALYASHNARQRAVEYAVESGRRECRTYYCDGCKGWHTTSQENRPRQLSFDLAGDIVSNHAGFVRRWA